jgi:GMP reductase
MRIIEDVKLDFKDVLITPKRSTLHSRNDVTLERSFRFKHGGEWSGVPIIAANMDGVGTFEMAEELNKHRCLVAVTKHYNLLELTNHFFLRLHSSVYSLGISDADLKKFDEVYNSTVLNQTMRVCIDVANGYTQTFVDFIKRFRYEYPDVVLMAGNVVTPEMTEELILAGADVVKVGIGPGSVCTTRKLTGIGYPQLSAIIECADAAHGLKGHIIADGGCSVPGDIAKAFAAGADFVMLGSMLAGHKEGLPPGYTDTVEGKSLVDFYGMSSKSAMDLHNGGVASYRASEGKHVKIPYRGEVSRTLSEILGGLRSACTYVGASELKELSKRTTFVRVTQQLNNSLNAYEI